MDAPGSSKNLFDIFEDHLSALESRKRKRRESLALKSTLETADEVAAPTTVGGEVDAPTDGLTLGTALPEDEYLGDTRFRTLNELLTLIDKSGMERSSQQVQFHAAFKIACLRILYKENWSISRPDIVKKHNVDRVFGEVVSCNLGMFSHPPAYSRVPRHADDFDSTALWQDVFVRCAGTTSLVLHVSHSVTSPRRVAMYCAAFALATGTEVVIFR